MQSYEPKPPDQERDLFEEALDETLRQPKADGFDQPPRTRRDEAWDIFRAMHRRGWTVSPPEKDPVGAYVRRLMLKRPPVPFLSLPLSSIALIVFTFLAALLTLGSLVLWAVHALTGWPPW